MQTLIQVFCKGTLGSLRKKIGNDKILGKYNFYIVEHKKINRQPGWSKLRAIELNGTLNFEWDARTKSLFVRVVNKGQGRPDILVGNFISYLLERHNKVIIAIQVIPIG